MNETLRRSLSADRAVRNRCARSVRRASPGLRAVRQSFRPSRRCSCTAARARAATRRIGGSSIPRSTGSCCSISAAPDARRRRRACTRTRLQHLVSDIETLRRHLRIDRWVVFGGSWGSTLGLAYAAAHPEACRALVLRGIWLCREIDIDWWFGPIRLIYPEYWQAFVDPIPPAERQRSARRLPATAAGSRSGRAHAGRDCVGPYETSCATLLPPAAEPVRANILSMPRIEAHYMQHRCFLRENELLDAVPRFRHVPSVIVHGRYDMLCPVEGALALAAVWPEAALAHRAGCRTRRDRARHPSSARCGDRSLPRSQGLKPRFRTPAATSASITGPSWPGTM